jgi:hypothetical protein
MQGQLSEKSSQQVTAMRGPAVIPALIGALRPQTDRVFWLASCAYPALAIPATGL